MDTFPDNLSDVMTAQGPGIVWGRDETGLVIVQLRETRVTIVTPKGYSYQTRVVHYQVSEVEPQTKINLAEWHARPVKVEQVSEPAASLPDPAQLAFTLA